MSKITEIKVLDSNEITYDITVKDNSNFFANGILVHNCLHWIANEILGPITVTSDTAALIPKLVLFETGIKPKTNYSNWTYAMGFLANSEERNKLIVKQVFKDLRDGHKILIICDRRIQIDTLVRMINRQARINNIKRSENWSTLLAAPFYQGVDKVKMLKNMDNGVHSVGVAITKMMKQGIDMKQPSMLYETVPTSNPAMFYQLVNRICTPNEGKQQPIARLFIDEMGQSKGCFRSIFRNEIMPNLQKKDSDKFKYLMDKVDYDKSMELLKAGNSGYKPNFYKTRKPY